MKTLIKKIMNDIDNEMIHDFKNCHKNIYIITGPISRNDLLLRVGRVEQVRKEAGEFGSDIVFLRSLDGGLCTHENQFFFKVKNKYKKDLDKYYISIGLPNYENDIYTIKGEKPEKGFIIQSKIIGSTPLKYIKKRIYNKLMEQ